MRLAFYIQQHYTHCHYLHIPSDPGILIRPHAAAQVIADRVAGRAAAWAAKQRSISAHCGQLAHIEVVWIRGEGAPPNLFTLACFYRITGWLPGTRSS